MLATHNEIMGKTPLLPDWDIRDCMKYGIKSGLVSLAYMLFFIIIFGITSTILFFAIRSSVPLLIIGALLSVIILFFISMPVSFALTSFAENFSFKDGFALKKIFKITFKVVPEYLLITLISVGFLIIICIFCILLGFISKIGNLHLFALINALASSYSFIVSLITYNLLAQVYKLGIQRIQPNVLINQEKNELL